MISLKCNYQKYFPDPMYDLKNKKIFISGGSGGIGLEVIKILLSKGSIVYNVDRNDIEIKDDRLSHYSMDLCKELPDLDDVEFDIMILNVAKNPGIKPFDEYSIEEVETSLFLNIQIHLKLLKKLKYKKIVFMNSVCSFVGISNFSIYCASKAFLSVFNESLRREGKDTFIIYPYKVNTDMFADMKDFGTIDKCHLARIIVSDIESGVKERVIPFIFSFTGLAKSIIPRFIFDYMVRTISRLFTRKPKPKVE